MDEIATLTGFEPDSLHDHEADDIQETSINLNHLPGNVLRSNGVKRRSTACAQITASEDALDVCVNVCMPGHRKYADPSMASGRASRSLFSAAGIIVMIHGQEMSIDCLCPEKSERALVGCLYKTVLSGRKEAGTSVWCAVEHSDHRTFARSDFIWCRNHNIKIETFQIFLRSFQKPARNP